MGVPFNVAALAPLLKATFFQKIIFKVLKKEH